jgi:heme a synthase
MSIISLNSDTTLSHERQIKAWLLTLIVMVFIMVLVGGATRLTDSGLSITEWKPITGAIPPLTEAMWLIEFEKYRQIPEYQLINKGMSLAEFKFIYWWEWGHRFWGRLMGLVLLFPLLYFWIKGMLTPWLKKRMVLILILGGMQGAMGWFMVMSGLSTRTDVAPLRLAAHLILASVVLSALVWVWAEIKRFGLRQNAQPAQEKGLQAQFFLYFVLMQIFLGGLVAGLDAGKTYQTWPLMDGYFIPPFENLLVIQPWWLNMYENPLTTQFMHRMGAYGLWAFALWQAFSLTRVKAYHAGSARGLLIMVSLQAAIGILTLLYDVQLHVALTHQGLGMLLLMAATYHLHLSKKHD